MIEPRPVHLDAAPRPPQRTNQGHGDGDKAGKAKLRQHIQIEVLCVHCADGLCRVDIGSVWLQLQVVEADSEDWMVYERAKRPLPGGEPARVANIGE